MRTSLVSLGVACFVFGLGVALGGRVEAVELHGRVLDVLHQRGVPGLTVRLTPPRGSHIPEQITMTDAEGGFSFRGLSRGPYLIEVSQALQPLYRQPIELQGDQQLEIELRAKPEPISPPPVSPSGPLPPK